MAKEYSDLDLAILGDEPVPLDAVAALADGFGESDLPFKVDVAVWGDLDDRMRAAIGRDGVDVQVVEVGGFGSDARIPADWRNLPFSEAVVINPRVALKRGCDYPHVDMALLTPGTRSVRAVATRQYRSGGSRFEPGDTLFARITPCLENGKTSRFDPTYPDAHGPAHGSTEFIVLRGRANVSDTRFVHYLARSPDIRDFAISQMTGTSGRQRVPTDCFDHLLVSVPPIGEQRAIANILGALDDKIELNRRMNETLEAMARALFKAWFVDFEPVRAKTSRRDCRLPPNVSNLFPGRITSSDHGDVPAGWYTYTLDELVEHHTESIAPMATPNAEFEHFSIPAYDAGRTPRLEMGANIKSNKTIVPHGSVLLSKLNPEIPRVWVPGESAGYPQVSSTEFLAFTPTGSASRSLLFSLFSDSSFRTLLTSMVTGTSKSHQRVPPRALKDRRVIWGTPAVFRAFGEIASPWVHRAIATRAESQTLANVRSTLLPKLLSGEIRVRQAEDAVAAVL